MIAELNSNVQAELKARSRLAAAYERWQRRRLLSRLDGLVAVTRELADEMVQIEPSFATTVISNGIELGSPAAPRADAGDERPRLVYLGEDVYWQGIDKLYQVAAAYPDWQFDLIGRRPAHRHATTSPVTATSTRRSTRRSCARRMSRSERSRCTANRWMRRARSRSGATSSTGCRCCSATGTPTSTRSTHGGFRLPNTEENVVTSLAENDSFVRGARGRRVPRDEVEPLISAAAKETARLAFFDEVVRRRSDDHV